MVLAMMMHQNETVVRIAELIAANPGGIESLGKDARRVSTAREIFRELVDLERRELLTDTAPAEEREKLRARLNQLYLDTFGSLQAFSRYRSK